MLHNTSIISSWCLYKAPFAFSQKHFVHVHTRVTAWACESLRASVSLCCSLCAYSRECAPSFSPLLAANEWRTTSPAVLAALGYEAGAGCFLMVIIHFVPGWIILHRLCLGPRGEPHKVNLASQKGHKDPKAEAAPHFRGRAPQHSGRTHKYAQNCMLAHQLHTLISYSQFQQAYTVIKRAACAKALTHSFLNTRAHAALHYILMIRNHFVGKVRVEIASKLQIWGHSKINHF